MTMAKTISKSLQLVVAIAQQMELPRLGVTFAPGGLIPVETGDINRNLTQINAI